MRTLLAWGQILGANVAPSCWPVPGSADNEVELTILGPWRSGRAASARAHPAGSTGADIGHSSLLPYGATGQSIVDS